MASKMHSPKWKFMTTQQLAQRFWKRRSDWAGFAFFAGWTAVNVVLAAGVLRKAPAVALFLVPTFIHDVVIAVAFLIRAPLRKQAEGWLPGASAYGATLFMPAFCFVCSHWRPEWMSASFPSLFVPGVVLWMMGACLGVWSVFYLRKSFSIVPQARTLVTAGPYRLARHPVYACYLLQYAGFVISHLTPALSAAFLVWLGVVLLRISYEESVLSAAFAEYAEYRQRVGRFMPRYAAQRKTKKANVPVSIPLPAVGNRSEI